MKNLKQAREATGKTAAQVAADVGCERGTLHRVEAGKQLPMRKLARSLFKYYKGEVPLAMIYDPLFVQEITK